MTSLAVFWDTEPAAPILKAQEHRAIATHLAEAGILFERWETVDLPPGCNEAAVAAAYARSVERLMLGRDFQTADVVSVAPDTPGLDAMRAKLRSEHTHTEDEARFFVAGSGCFFLHLGRKVYRVACAQGDLISVPAGVRHWFTMGERPRFTAIRFFTRPDGWVAAYTGDAVADRFPHPV